MPRPAIGALGALAWMAVAVPSAGAATEDRVPALGASTNAVDACAASFPAGTFARAASEADVTAGQPVAVDVTWRPAWFPGEQVSVLGCVALNGRFVDGTVARDVETSGGLWVHRFAVPPDAAEPGVVCQAALVMGVGDAARATRSEPDCFTVTAAAPAAAPAPVPAPVAAPVSPRTAAAVLSTPTTAADVGATRAAAAATPEVPAAPVSSLPHTGAGERALAVLAGALLVFGGWGLAVRRPSALQ